MTTISAVLLAAGESRRMQGVNKLGLPIGNIPLLRHTVQTLLASRLQELIVVLGHEADTLRPLVESLPTTLVYNKNYREGQMTSVHMGLASLTQQCDAVMVCLADQPLLTPEDINSLIDAFAKHGNSTVVVPTYQGKRGNPIILADKHREVILSGKHNLGCKRFIERNPQLVTTIEMPTNHVVVDMDTLEDYVNIRRLLRLRHEMAAISLTSAIGR